ncbi:MAG: GNAT family N-acetyltransferase [Tepidisphaera sp.]|nr:GNAT family N-acetyltransferase [Tepidisphaera sp.]
MSGHSSQPAACKIRPATDADRPFVFAMVAQLSQAHEAYDAKRWVAPAAIAEVYDAWFARAAAGDDLAIFIAHPPGEAALGYLVAEAWPAMPQFWSPACVYVHDIFVNPAARAGGAGEALLNAARAWGRERGLTQVRALVSSHNKAALTYFERRGFRVSAAEITLDL